MPQKSKTEQKQKQAIAVDMSLLKKNISQNNTKNLRETAAQFFLSDLIIDSVRPLLAISVQIHPLLLVSLLHCH